MRMGQPKTQAGGAPLTRQDEFGCRTLVVFKGAGFDFSFSPHLGSVYAPPGDHDWIGLVLSAAQGFLVGGANRLVGTAGCPGN